ncbi:hypothetical protein Tco_0895798 [Tanacetum coccineum]|uniref:Uncharacterized protein n=1 Tax=Tanacetum coccineum TaxID=301880 RepID=A0ABQ5CJ19_9ASTR
MKAMQDQIRAGVIPYKTDQEILDEVVLSDNRQNMSGMGRKLQIRTSRRRANQAFADVMTREQMTQILRQKEQENELLRKQAEEAHQRASAAYQNTETMYGAVGQFFSHYNSPNSARPFIPPAFTLVPPPLPDPTMPQLAPEWAHLLNPPMPYNQQLPPQYTGPPGYTGYTGPLQRPYTGQFPLAPVTNNNFNNCYSPVINSNHASSSSSIPELPRFITNSHMNDTRSIEQLAQDNATEDNNEEEDEQQSGGDYSSDEEAEYEEEE